MIFNKKNESLLNMSRVMNNEKVAPVTALDSTTTTAIVDNEAAEAKLEEVKKELDKTAEGIAGEKPEEKEAPIKNVFTAKVTLQEDLEDFSDTQKDGRSNKLFDDDGMNVYLDYDMFQFILDLFVTIPEFETVFPESMFPEIDIVSKDGKRVTKRRVRSSFMYQGSDDYLTGEGVKGVSQVGTEGDNIVLYGDTLDVFKSVKVLCDYFGLKYTEPRERRSPSSRWAFSMKIYTPMMSRGYPEMFIDYIEKQGLDYHDFMKSRFITGYERALQKENEEKNEVICQRKIKEVVKKFADQVEPTTKPVDKKQIQQAMIDELAKTTIEGVGGETMPLKFSESKAKTLFNSMVKDNLHK